MYTMKRNFSSDYYICLTADQGMSKNEEKLHARINNKNIKWLYSYKQMIKHQKLKWLLPYHELFGLCTPNYAVIIVMIEYI